jgi:hypothetical protein
MPQRKIVIHNHLPVLRVKDAETSEHTCSLCKGRGYIQGYKCTGCNGTGKTTSAKDADINYSIVMKGWMFRHGSQSYGPFKSESEAEQKLSALKGA